MMKKKSQPAGRQGFTLIELLVVITLIGVLAIAVLSAINPIEQINKARDAGRRSDAAQLIKAEDRYYASNEEFPWNNSTTFSDYVAAVDLAFKQTAEKAGVGICGVASVPGTVAEVNIDANGCVNEGLLISSEELKSQFSKRKAFRLNAVKEDVLYVVKEANDPSVSVCFIPSSKAARTNWAKLKAVDLAATPSITDCAAEPTWVDADNSCFVCIPEE